MRNGEVLEERMVCSFMTRSSSGAAASIPASMWVKHRTQVQSAGVLGVERKEERKRGEKQHIM